MKKIKVLILQGIIPSYREPIYNLLGEKYDLTIGYTLNTQVKSDFFIQKKISHKKIQKLISSNIRVF